MESEFTLGDLAGYPFLPEAEAYMKHVGFTLDEIPARVLERAKARVSEALRRGHDVSIELHDPDVEILSFFVASLLVKACGSSYLTNRFGLVEGLRSAKAFAREKPFVMAKIIERIVGAKCTPLTVEETRQLAELDPRFERYGTRPSIYRMDVADYLKAASPLLSTGDRRWKLVNNMVDRGLVFLDKEMLGELFADDFGALVSRRIQSMPRPTRLPPSLERVIGDFLQRLPRPRPSPGAPTKYDYVEKLLERPVTDGRHRIVWLILAPYLVNIKGVDDVEAQAQIIDYLHRCGWREEPVERFVRYHVQRARRIGLKPPGLTTLLRRDSGLYRIITQTMGEPGHKPG